MNVYIAYRPWPSCGDKPFHPCSIVAGGTVYLSDDGFATLEDAYLWIVEYAAKNGATLVSGENIEPLLDGHEAYERIHIINEAAIIPV